MFSFKKTIINFAIGFSVFSALNNQAWSSTVYTHTTDAANPVTEVSSTGPSSLVTFTITTPYTLAANSTYNINSYDWWEQVSSDYVSWTANDSLFNFNLSGVTTINPVTYPGKIGSPNPAGGDWSNLTGTIITDGSGNIFKWNLWANRYSTANSSSVVYGGGDGDLIKAGTSPNYYVYGYSNGVSGGWSVGSPSPVPVPASVWLMLSGLCGLGFVSRKRKQ